MSDLYTVTPARKKDLPQLAHIELSAAQLLAGHAPPSVLAEVTGEEELEHARAKGQLWVVLADDIPVGFAHVEVLEANVAHLEEIDVLPQHMQRGLGTRLVRAVCEWAERERYHSVTLTTFRDLRFNMPFYASLGFQTIPRHQLSAALLAVVRDETRRGLDPLRRVAMRKTLRTE